MITLFVKGSPCNNFTCKFENCFEIINLLNFLSTTSEKSLYSIIDIKVETDIKNLIGREYFVKDNSYCINIETGEQAYLTKDYQDKIEEDAKFKIVSMPYVERCGCFNAYRVLVDIISLKTNNVYRVLFNEGWVGETMAVRYKWIGCSNDYSYEEKSKVVFNSKKDCYNSMRDAVLNKMKWNTEYDEDFVHKDDAVGYEVRFTQDMIVHSSFSGCYVYKIILEEENPKYEDIFNEETIKKLKELGIYNFTGF